MFSLKELIVSFTGRETDNRPNGVACLGRAVRYYTPGERVPDDCFFDQRGRACEILPEVVVPCEFSPAPLGKISLPRENENLTWAGIPLDIPKGSHFEGEYCKPQIKSSIIDGRGLTSNTQNGGSFAGKISALSRYFHESTQFWTSEKKSLGSGKATYHCDMKQKLGVVRLNNSPPGASIHVQGICYEAHQTSSYGVASGKHQHGLATQGQESFEGNPNGGTCVAGGGVTDMTSDMQGPYAMYNEGVCDSTVLLDQSVAEVDQGERARFFAKVAKPYMWDRRYFEVSFPASSPPGLNEQLVLPSVQVLSHFPHDIAAYIATPRTVSREIRDRVDLAQKAASSSASSPASSNSSSK